MKALRFIVFFFSSCILFVGCEKINIRQDFDFEVEFLPYHSEDILPYQMVELRGEIVGDSGYFSGTQYFVRYFQQSGTGQLISEDGTAFTENDDFELPNKKFRLYYTPSLGANHNLKLTFFDSWQHQKEVEISISMHQNQSE
jgi:hypothetical protein